MATKYKLQDVNILKGRDVFVDANVLIYLFWATGQYNYEKSYASVFYKLLKQGNNLYVDFLVVSEVVNRTARNELKRILGRNPNPKEFKTFRDSQEGQDTLNDIYTIFRDDVLKRFNMAGKNFDKATIESFLTVDNLDFVDKAIVALCKENNLVLLTNDRDFKDADLDILTGNVKILA